MSAPRREATKETGDRAILARLTQAMRLIAVPFPHLSGLAAAMRIELDDRIPTMGVFASGRMLANRAFTMKLSPADLQFVLAHEVLHLALRTHERARGASPLEFNYAHDYIINDMLRHALKLTSIPAGGLDMEGAREKSAEQIVLEMRRKGSSMQARSQVFDGVVISADEVLSGGRGTPGENGQGADKGDVLDAARERQMFPQDAEEQEKRARAIRDLAARGMAMAKALGALRARGDKPGSDARNVRALRGVYRTPWQIALQRWIEGVSPGERTFTRPSRRGAERTDIVLPGRQRYSMLLNVVLDTSGSMTDEIPNALGAIADFCEATGIDEIRVVQCDTTVTGDEMLSPAELAEFEVRGYGGSDLTPALAMLAEDPRVTAAIVITDGDITYPDEPTPYSVLWAVPGETTTFAPRYGRVVAMRKGEA
jgi:predicted metal-dependent peptidase